MILRCVKWARIRRSERRDATPLLGFLLRCSFFLLLFGFFPTGIGVVFLHGFGEDIGLLAEILLIDNSVGADDEGHYAGRLVFRRICHESETLGHFAVYDVTLRATRGTFALTRQDAVIVTAVRSRGAFLALRRCLWGGPGH